MKLGDQSQERWSSRSQGGKVKGLDFPTPEGDQWEAIETDQFLFNPGLTTKLRSPSFPQDPVMKQALLEVVESCEWRRLFLRDSTAGSL